jgi:hypothetical protein
MVKAGRGRVKATQTGVTRCCIEIETGNFETDTLHDKLESGGYI